MLLRTGQVARLLGRPVNTIIFWCVTGKLKSIKVHKGKRGRIYIPVTALRDILPPEMYQTLIDTLSGTPDIREYVRQCLQMPLKQHKKRKRETAAKVALDEAELTHGFKVEQKNKESHGS